MENYTIESVLSLFLHKYCLTTKNHPPNSKDRMLSKENNLLIITIQSQQTTVDLKITINKKWEVTK